MLEAKLALPLRNNTKRGTRNTRTHVVLNKKSSKTHELVNRAHHVPPTAEVTAAAITDNSSQPQEEEATRERGKRGFKKNN